MATTTAAKTVKGFRVLCPMCGDAEATVRMDLNNLSQIECGSCGETFSARGAATAAAENAKRWEAVARWVEMAGEAVAAAAGDDGQD